MASRFHIVDTLVLCCCALLSLTGYGAAQDAPTEYRVGPSDVLNIVVIGRPEVSGAFVVDESGSITLPLVGRMEVAGSSTSTVTAKLAQRLAEGFLRDPQVSVTIQEFRSQRIFVVGEVRQPGPYPISGQITVIEALARAGSTTAQAGTEALILRPSDAAAPHKPASDTSLKSAPAASADAKKTVIRVDLRKLETGILVDNILLQDGDTLLVPRSEQVFVFGQVRSPGAYQIRKDMTILQVLTLAGGVTDRGATNRVRIQRMVNGTKKELSVELSDIVQADDTVIVPERFF